MDRGLNKEMEQRRYDEAISIFARASTDVFFSEHDVRHIEWERGGVCWYEKEECVMITTSEIAVTAVIWVLAVVGGFFSVRAAWRRKNARRGGKER